jgi:hypothetical protein
MVQLGHLNVVLEKCKIILSKTEEMIITFHPIQVPSTILTRLEKEFVIHRPPALSSLWFRQ